MASSSKETTDAPSSKIDGLSMVLSKFKGGLESFQSLIQELNQAVEKEREQLKADRAMFSGRHNLRTDEAGCFFVDRDARHFHAILNYLRDGQLNYPSDGTDFKYLLELRAEAEYYGLTGLVALIDRYPYGLTRIQRAANLNTEDSWMYEDGQDEGYTVELA
ncbi:BTB domain-containing protein [Haematococcus lacustris]|uniref:BTB domain-containing protein n=1 Tax=Haematococcus lacustris TaxID=44745 RepID=A0A699YVI2_HAELA|nr:BTB domain-containing protein [Haematococcus lacustris]